MTCVGQASASSPSRKAIMLCYRSTRPLSNFKFCLFFCLTGLAPAEPVIILDPYFYRTPLAEVIDGSTKTVLAYYDESDGKDTPLPNPPRQAVSELRILAIAYAQAILEPPNPKLIRDKHGLLVATLIEDHDQPFSAILQ